MLPRRGKGLLIGDGNIFVRLRLVSKKDGRGGSIWIIPMLSLYQLDTSLNKNLYDKLYKLFDSLGVTYTTTSYRINTSRGLSIEGDFVSIENWVKNTQG